MRIALGVLAALVTGVLVFAVALYVLASSGDPDAVLGEMLDALPAAATAGMLTFAALTTWVIVGARRRRRRDTATGASRSHDPREGSPTSRPSDPQVPGS